jgi:hypothetical protein
MADTPTNSENLNPDLFKQGKADLQDFLPFNGEKINMHKDMFLYKPVVPSLIVNQLPIQERVVGYPGQVNKKSTPATAQDWSNYMTNSLQKLQSNESFIRPHSYDASAQGAHKAKYKAFGQKTYDRVGFNPEMNNELMYNSQTTGIDRAIRMFQHSAVPLFIKGAISGPKSYAQMAQGNFGGDIDEALDYEEAAAIGYSSVGGLGGFVNNIFNSFSYTLGIFGEGMVEGAVIGGAIGTLAGPEGTAVGVVGGGLRGGIASLLKAPKALWNIAETGSKLLKKVNSLKDVGAARTFFNATVNAGAKFINPIENSWAYGKAAFTGADEFKNLSNLAKVSKGFGAFYFDVRNINMALSEGRLEGGMKENETYREMYEKYYNENGEAPSDDLQAQYRKVANQVGNEVTLKNAVLINYSNKLTVPNIMQGSARRLLGTSEKIMSLKGADLILDPKAGFKIAEKGFKQSLAALKKPATYGKVGLSYFKRNLVEGLQEVSQDVIGEATKNYYMDSYYDPAKATFDYSMGTVRNATKKQFSAQGWETFASGFAMGSLQGGIEHIGKAASIGYNKIFNKEKYAENIRQTAESKIRAQEVVDSLNEIYKDPIEFFNSAYFNYGTQSRVARIHDDEEADTKAVKDAKNAAFVSSVYHMLETGTSKQFIENFKDLQKLEPEQLEEAMKLKPGEGVAASQKIDKVIEKVKRMQKTHTFWTEKMKSPVKLSNYKKDTPQYEMAAVFQKAWQKGQFNAIFLDESFKDNLERLNNINTSLDKLSGSQIINVNDIQLITDPERFLTEIDLLTEEINVLKTLKDDKSKKQVTQKTNKLEAMQDMMEDYTNYHSHFVSKTAVKERIEAIKQKEGLTGEDADIIAMQQVEKDLKDAGVDYKQKYKDSFTNYLKSLVKGGEDLLQVENGLKTDTGIQNLEDAFNHILDYHGLKNENKVLAKYVNLFLTPEGFAEHVKRNFDWMKNLYQNRKDYVKDTVNKSITNLEYNDLLAALADEDIYVDLDEFADWIEDHNNKPSHFIQESNKRIIPEGSELYNEYYETFITIAERHINKPSGPDLTVNEKLKDTIDEKQKQKDKELEDAKIAFNTQLKRDTGYNEEEINKLKQEANNENSQELEDAKAKLENLKGIIEQLEKIDVDVEELQAVVDGAIDNEIATEGEINLFVEEYFKNPKKVEEATPFVQDLITEAVLNGLSQEEATTQAFVVASYKFAFPELIKEKINTLKDTIEELSKPEVDVIDIETTDAWKDYQALIKKINEDYEEVFNGIIKDFKKAGATPSTVEEVNAIPERVTVTTPWSNIPDDLKVILQKEFDTFANSTYPNEDATALAIIRQNWLGSQSLLIDQYNNAQIGTENVEPELIARIPKFKSIANTFDSKTLDQLSVEDLKGILNILKTKLPKTKVKSKEANNIKSDINALQSYIRFIRTTRKATTNLESIVNLLNTNLLERQDEIDVLFTDGTTGKDVKSLEDLATKTKKGYIFDNGKEPQRVTKLVVDIEKEETGKDPYINQATTTAVGYYMQIEADTTIKESGKLKAFLDRLDSEIKNNKTFKQFNEIKFAKIKTALEKEFTEKSVFSIINDLSYSAAADSGTLIDGLIRDFFNDVKLIKPSNMSQGAFDSLFGQENGTGQKDGILTLIKDDVIDGKYTVYANNLNVFDKDLGDTGLAGEMDLLVVDNKGNISIIDIKTAQKATWDNFNKEGTNNFSKKYAYRTQQTIYKNLLYNMTGKKATIKLLPIELNYDVNGYIKSAKLATEIVDKGKSTVELVPVDAVDKYVPLKNIEDINIETEEQDRSEIQKLINSLENELVIERDVMGDLEKAAQITQQITELQAQLNVVQETPTTDTKAELEIELKRLKKESAEVMDVLDFENGAIIRDKIEAIENKLAALSTTDTTADETSIEDAKKIIKSSSALGDFVIDVNEEGEIVIPKFDDLLQPMQSARKISDLMIAYANAMIAVTEGNIPGDSNALINAIELKFNEKQVALGSKVSDKNLSKDDYIIAKKAIFDSVRGDIFIVSEVNDKKVKIKLLTTNKIYTATNEELIDNFKKHNKMAYEITNEPVAITEEDTAAVVETKNNLDDIKKDLSIFDDIKIKTQLQTKLQRFSKLKNNSPIC